MLASGLPRTVAFDGENRVRVACCAHGLALNAEGRRWRKGTVDGDKLAAPLKR